MGRRSIIASHSEREKIEADILAGVPGNEIARRYDGVSESAISRWRGLHYNALQRFAEESEHAPDELIDRLKQLADSMHHARKVADATASPTVRARVAASELAVLDRLVDRLGITDLTSADALRTTGNLVRAVQKFVLDNPQHARDLFEVMGTDEELIDLRDALRAQLKARNAR